MQHRARPTDRAPRAWSIDRSRCCAAAAARRRRAPPHRRRRSECDGRPTRTGRRTSVAAHGVVAHARPATARRDSRTSVALVLQRLAAQHLIVGLADGRRETQRLRAASLIDSGLIGCDDRVSRAHSSTTRSRQRRLRPTRLAKQQRAGSLHDEDAVRAWCREWLTLGNCRGGPCVRHQQIDRARADGRHLKGAAHALFVVRQPRRRSSRATMPTSTSSRACTKSNPTPRNTLSAAKLHDKKKKRSR